MREEILRTTRTALQPMKPGVKPRGERSLRLSQPGDPNVSEQPSPGACVLLGMLGGGGGVSKKTREMERGSGLLRVTTHPSVPRSAAERQTKRGERGKEGVG